MAEEAKPSDAERSRVLQPHADRTMRYYATAYLRGDEDDRQLMSAYMAITASVISLIEGDRLDDRGMLEFRGKIIDRYLEQAKSDPFEPGNCSFCGERPVVAWFEGPSFRTFVRSSAEVRAEEAWLACVTCLALVETDDREALVARRMRRSRSVAGERAEGIERGMLDERFRRRRRDPES